LLRLVLIVTVTSCLFAVWWLGQLLLRRSSQSSHNWRRRLVRLWSRATVRLLGARVTSDGPIPPAPCVLVSNHLGYVDIPILASCLDTLFVSKVEVRSWPLIGRAASAIGTIFVDRTSRRSIPAVNARIRAALSDQDRVLFFPEGTSTGGSGVLAFKSSLLEPAADSGYPVFCAAVHYSTLPGAPHASQAVCWWGDMDFQAHFLRLLRLSQFHARVVFHAQPHLGGGRKQLAERTEQVVKDLHRILSQP
jgi:1-acyl-sn-glycerol-3-phosphate acyltransferase